MYNTPGPWEGDQNKPVEIWDDQKAIDWNEKIEPKGDCPMKSVLQDWVMQLGLRHQGVLIAAVRGCDGLPRDHATKLLVRGYRSTIMNAHVGDPVKSASFIKVYGDNGLLSLMNAVLRDPDDLPLHYLVHLMHAVEIVGYNHPDTRVANQWLTFYKRLCHRLHLTPETESELDERLDASEDDFKSQQALGMNL